MYVVAGKAGALHTAIDSISHHKYCLPFKLLSVFQVKLSKQPSEKEEESGSVVEALKLEMQERNAEKGRKLRELQDHSNFQTQEVSIHQRIIYTEQKYKSNMQQF